MAALRFPRPRALGVDGSLLMWRDLIQCHGGMGIIPVAVLPTRGFWRG